MSRPTSLNSDNRVFPQARNLRHIHSEEFVGFGTQIEFWTGRPFLHSACTSSFPVGWKRSFCGVDARLELGQHFLDFQIAIHDLLLTNAVQISRSNEGKEMLGPPVAF